jgi:type I protein arginine methyltransferase
MYSIAGYGEMIADHVRMTAYSDALSRSVNPDSVVLDIGTGAGILALLACKFGAKRVYAIEPADAIQTAREIAVANGYSERIVFLQNTSTQTSLPERADVILSDLRGVLPLFQNHIRSIVDARQRLLAEGGIQIPQRDLLWATVVSTPELYADYVSPWCENGYGLDLRAAQLLALNTWRKARVKSEQLLAEPKCWATLDYNTIESPDVHAEVSWTVTRTGAGHGLSLWFDTVLINGVGFSNGPDAPELIYGNAFFPWLKPVDLEVGDIVNVYLSADLVGEDYVWRWNTKVISRGNPKCVKSDFKQSSFFGVPLSSAQLRKRSGSHLPVLNDEGTIEQVILSLMDGKTTLENMARQLKLRFPDRFLDWKDALSLAGDVSVKYSR